MLQGRFGFGGGEVMTKGTTKHNTFQGVQRDAVSCEHDNDMVLRPWKPNRFERSSSTLERAAIATQLPTTLKPAGPLEKILDPDQRISYLGRIGMSDLSLRHYVAPLVTPRGRELLGR